MFNNLIAKSKNGEAETKTSSKSFQLEFLNSFWQQPKKKRKPVYNKT